MAVHQQPTMIMAEPVSTAVLKASRRLSSVLVFFTSCLAVAAPPGQSFEPDFNVAIPLSFNNRTSVEVRDEEEFLKIPIAIAAKAVVSKRITGSHRGVNWTIQAGDVLLRHYISPTNLKIKILPYKLAFCTNQIASEQNMRKIVQANFKVCLLDRDHNNVFDAFVIDGIKGLVELVGVPLLGYFRTIENSPRCDLCYIRLTYYNGGAGSPNIAYTIVLDGKEQSTPGVTIQSFDNPDKVLKLDNWQFTKKNMPLPQSFDFGFARVAVTLFDKKAKTAKLNIAMPDGSRMFAVRPQSGFHYIYF